MGVLDWAGGPLLEVFVHRRFAFRHFCQHLLTPLFARRPSTVTYRHPGRNARGMLGVSGVHSRRVDCATLLRAPSGVLVQLNAKGTAPIGRCR